MHDGVNEPETAPVPSRDEPRPAGRMRAAVLLGIGGGVGLALGVLLTVGVSGTYTFFNPMLPPTRESVQIFHELNELRQHVNRLNEERKLQDLENVQAIRQALSAVAATARSGDGGTPSAAAPVRKPGGTTDQPPVRRTWDPLVELDEEIKRLEETQRVLNTILDLFTPKAKERSKDRPGVTEPPK
jgi:hypothetical protein